MKKYHEDKLLVNEIMDVFRQNDNQRVSLTKMSQESGIPVKVLSNQYANFKECKSYVPGNAIGQHRRYFTAQEEEIISGFLRLQFINPGIMIRRNN